MGRSPIVTDTFASWMTSITVALDPLWTSMNRNWNGTNMADRLLQANAAHNLILVLVVVGLLVLKLLLRGTYVVSGLLCNMNLRTQNSSLATCACV